MTVLDLGANHGRFSEVLSQRAGPGAFTAVEANPALILDLERQGTGSVRHGAVTDRECEVVFRVARNDAASSILALPDASVYDAVEVDSVLVPGIALSQLIAQTPGDIDVVKLDIEGAEVAALASLSDGELARIAQITVEFHSDPTFGFDLLEATRQVIAQLEGAGFLALDFEPGLKDVLFLNRERLSLTRADAVRCRATAYARRTRIRAGATRRRVRSSGRLTGRLRSGHA